MSGTTNAQTHPAPTPGGTSASAMHAVLNQMKELFISGKVKAGDLLPPENDLAKSMSVSRSSVREAMKVLEAFGLVEIKRGNGTFVTNRLNTRSFNPLLFHLVLEGRDFTHIMELRQCIEVSIIRLIIQHGEDRDFAAIRGVLDDMEIEIGTGSLDTERIFQYELLFHQALGRATHNPLVMRIYDFVMEFFSPSIMVTANELSTDSGRETLAIHRHILEGLETRDLLRAEYAIVSSLKAWEKSYAEHSE